MSRDHTKLRVFQLADELVLEVYRGTSAFPQEERFGLQSQIRRAAVSVPTNIVEGCARQSGAEYAHFLSIAMGSASETRYLLRLAQRLGYLDANQATQTETRYDELIRSLQKLISTVHGMDPYSGRCKSAASLSEPKELRPGGRRLKSDA